jgi:hypothetical protein
MYHELLNNPVTHYLQGIELTYSEWGATATKITSFLGSGVLLLAV